MSTAGSFNISQTRYRDVRENFVTAHFSKLTPPPSFFFGLSFITGPATLIFLSHHKN